MAACTTANSPSDSNAQLGGAGAGGSSMIVTSGGAGGNAGGSVSIAGNGPGGAPGSANDPDASVPSGGGGAAGNGGAAGSGGAAGGSALITGPEAYFGVTVDPGACLDVTSSGTTDGTPLQEWSCNASGAQRFIVDDEGNGAVRLVNPAAQKCVVPAGQDNNARLELAPCDGSAGQNYSLKDAGSGRISIVHQSSNKCLDVAGGHVASGTAIQLYDCNKSAAQQWIRANVGTGYTTGCGVAQLQAGRVLAANCRNDAKTLASPQLDLNACLSNQDGALVWQSGGGFAGSCSGCTLSGGNSLTCQCKNVSAQSVSTHIDLSANINDCNGVLTCGACGSGSGGSSGPWAFTALYGSDGNDFYQFTGASSVANLKPSGWNALFMFGITIQSNGDITHSGTTLVHDGIYVGDANWGPTVDALKAPPTTVTRYEVTLGGWGDTSYDVVKSLVGSQGTGAGSTLYKNFAALKKAVPGIDAINDDDEQAYDLGSSTAFGKMLNGLGMKLSQAPYMNQSFWVQLKNNLGSGADIVYLQCYQGGAGNDPGNWDAAYGNGFHVVPGQESNNHAASWWSNWSSADHVTGGFYWPDVTWAPNANWGVFEIASGLRLPPR